MTTLYVAWCTFLNVSQQLDKKDKFEGSWISKRDSAKRLMAHESNREEVNESVGNLRLWQHNHNTWMMLRSTASMPLHATHTSLIHSAGSFMPPTRNNVHLPLNSVYHINNESWYCTADRVRSICHFLDCHVTLLPYIYTNPFGSHPHL